MHFCATSATRLAPLPCSKELYPIGLDLEHKGAPKVACHYLLEKMQAAGITKAYIVLREGKWDVPAFLGDGGNLQMHLAYLVVGPTAGVPYTLDRAYPFVRDAAVAFGFPDILFEGDDAFGQLLSQQALGGADIILGLFPAARPETMDMVEIGPDNQVTDLVIQPRHTHLHYSWDVAVWTPAFTDFLHNYLSTFRPHLAKGGISETELSVGHVIQTAIREGLKVTGIPVSAEPYFDIGTPEELEEALLLFATGEEV